jgi:hypothetical protein
MWALVDPNAKEEVRKFSVYGTGHDIHADNIQFLGTVCLMGGRLILHAFEIVGGAA